MANTTSKVDGLDICTAIVNINGVAAANIQAVNVWDKKSCTTCNTIKLAYDRKLCSTACRGKCVTYGTDGTPGSLQLGDRIYEDFASCTECAADGFYSDVPCGESDQGCFTLRDCRIIRIDECKK